LAGKIDASDSPSYSEQRIYALMQFHAGGCRKYAFWPFNCEDKIGNMKTKGRDLETGQKQARLIPERPPLGVQGNRLICFDSTRMENPGSDGRIEMRMNEA
jgi:hypothetical protein